jgi:osmotically-inducible protein OsmY
MKRLCTALLSSLVYVAVSARAQPPPASAASPLDTIVVYATAEEKVAHEVTAALASDRYFYDAHVTVTVKNGVVTLHGIVFDDWDLRTALRIARRAPGVKRVVNDLEIKLGGE